MPPPPPISPLRLEICSPPTSEVDLDGLPGSDDELDDAARSARYQRIERLAEAYLQGTPLFMLSASLRGPFDKDWVNPWKKSRRKVTKFGGKHGHSYKGHDEVEDIVIQETNSRKRRRHHEVQDIRGANSPIVPSDMGVGTSLKNGSLGSASGKPKALKLPSAMRTYANLSSHPTPKRSLPWARPSDRQAQDQEPSPFIHHDASWLKKDQIRIDSKNINPPTSPTTTVSSRHSELKARAATSVNPRSHTAVLRPQIHSHVTSTDLPRSPAHTFSRHSSIVRTDVSHERVFESPIKQTTHNDKDHDPVSGPTKEHDLLCIVSSSSQLPKFEYRRRRLSSDSGQEPIKSSSAAKIEQMPQESNPPANSPLPPLPSGPRNVSFVDHATCRQWEISQESHTLRKESILRTTQSNSELGQEQPAILPIPNSPSDKLFSAQQVPGTSAMMDCVTSLHTIAVSKENTNYDGDTIPDPPFCTQAAVMLAQRSFQNGLDSPEHDPPFERENNQSRTPRPPSSPATNITPFCHLNIPHRIGTPEHLKQDSSARVRMMSTQGIIDAVTPFTFSTAKKKTSHHIYTSSRSHSSKKNMKNICSGTNLSPSVDSSPSSSKNIESNHQSPGNEKDTHIVSQRTSSPQEHQSPSQISALPMTLSGTTPPTAQDGQGAIGGAESFNLSQAIADAGSWLQQSFEINKDLQRCTNSASVPS